MNSPIRKVMIVIAGLGLVVLAGVALRVMARPEAPSLRASSHLCQSTPVDVELTWDPVPGAVEYEVQHFTGPRSGWGRYDDLLCEKLTFGCDCGYSASQVPDSCWTNAPLRTSQSALTFTTSDGAWGAFELTRVRIRSRSKTVVGPWAFTDVSCWLR